MGPFFFIYSTIKYIIISIFYVIFIEKGYKAGVVRDVDSFCLVWTGRIIRMVWS